VWGDVSQNERLEALPEGYLTYHPRDLIAVDTKRKKKKKKKKKKKQLKKTQDKGGRESSSSNNNINENNDDDDDDGGECRLLPRMLARVVGSTSPLRGESAGWAKHVARLTNLDRPAVQEKGSRPLSQLFYHQLVFSPVAGLLYCFHPETYVAHEHASSGYGLALLTTKKRKGLGVRGKCFRHHHAAPQPRAVRVPDGCRVSRDRPRARPRRPARDEPQQLGKARWGRHV
jgi:hypothetical protein